MTYPVQLHVKATGVTHRLSLGVASPQSGGAGVAVSAAKAGPARCGLLQVKRGEKRHPSEKQLLTFGMNCRMPACGEISTCPHASPAM